MMDYETATRFAKSEANLYRTPMYVLQATGDDVNRFTVASCYSVLGLTQYVDPKQWSHLMPVLPVFPSGPFYVPCELDDWEFLDHAKSDMAVKLRAGDLLRGKASGQVYEVVNIDTRTDYRTVDAAWLRNHRGAELPYTLSQVDYHFTKI